jgi:hypothetical protein
VTNRVRIHPVFATSLRAIVLEDPVTKVRSPLAVDTRARLNGHPRPSFDTDKHTDLAVLSQRVGDSISVLEEAARCLKVLNRTRAEIREVEGKAAKYDDMVAVLAKSEQENVDLKRQMGEMQARLALIREAGHDWINEKHNTTEFTNIVVNDILDLRHSG